jgi:hypothetical membrane protein
VPLLLGLGMTVSFALFAALSATRFPRTYGPWSNNTVSQLGNINLNPRGAYLYLAGCAVSGLLAIAFFISLRDWTPSGSPVQNRVLLLVRILGGAGGVGLFMNAVFPENHYAMHHFWAGLVFNAFAASLILAPFALWRQDRSRIPLVIFCALGFCAVIVMFTFSGSHWIEWLPVVMLLAFPPFVGIVGISFEPSES